jgi:uncharacterized lipoprotein YddW (UPF0748 family)
MVRIIFIIIALFVATVSQAQQKELRAAWIATVDNIDWPRKGNWDADSQKAEFVKIVAMHKRNGLNALVVQIRPATDAFYPSQYEPWSEWLTGKQGTPPQPYYDPLQFMVEECHKQGFEFHAWFNPYRAVFDIKKQKQLAPTHISKIHPEWFVTYGDKRYFDPGNKAAQAYVIGVVEDVVRRYNIDAIHFDDYFYPYKIKGKDFPDSKTFKKYANGLSKDDWRRSNCDSIIVGLSRAIKKIRSTCKFGISPFGIWRNIDKDPEGSNTIGGTTNYDDLYADILLWLRSGWIDYVAPQLYWEFEHKIAPYQTLLDWWNEHTYGKHLYIGLGIYRAGSNSNWKDVTQLPRQIEALREKENVKGMMFFSSKTFESNPNGWCDELRLKYFKQPALIPEMAWLNEGDSTNSK